MTGTGCPGGEVEVGCDVVANRLCERVRGLEVALKDLIDESLERDNHGPQPALQRAIAVLRPAAQAVAGAAMPETDWTVLGQHVSRALGVVAHERLDLHGAAAYGEALRLVVAARLLVTMEMHEAEVAGVASVADWNRAQAESERRRRLADVAELRRTMERQVADRMAGLADELRAKAEREKLGQHVRRGVRLAADWLAAPAARWEAAEDQCEVCS
jgi:hypothetical protein